MEAQQRRLDRKYIDVNDLEKLWQQARYIGKKPQEVMYAVSQVGPEMDAVAAFLKA